MSQRKTLTVILLVGVLTLVLVVGAIFYFNNSSDSTTSSGKGATLIPIWIAALTPIIVTQILRKDKRKNHEDEDFDD